MNATDYQNQAARTLMGWTGTLNEEQTLLIGSVLGLVGEAGEVAEVIKKAVLHRHGLDHSRLASELGDTLWYIAALCTILGIRLEDVMTANIEKLKNRYPAGWTAKDSISRKE